MADGLSEARRRILAAEAPVAARGVWKREGDTVYLCGTLGGEFDRWQRARAAVSAADAYFANEIGLEAVEAEMDSLEDEARSSLASGEALEPRRSPGYAEMPLSYSREILGRLDATRRIGVALTEEMLLVPSKSVTAVCAVVKTGKGEPSSRMVGDTGLGPVTPTV